MVKKYDGGENNKKLLSRGLARRPLHLSSADHVHVKVINRLRAEEKREGNGVSKKGKVLSVAEF